MKDRLEVRVESAAFEAGAVAVAELRGREAISRLFEFELSLVTIGGVAIDEEALLTNGITIVFERQTLSGAAIDVRRVSGLVRSVRDRLTLEAQHREYVVSVVPRAWMASLTTTSDVCMDMSVPDILVKKLAEGARLDPNKDIQLRLSSSYATREFVVQYKESNLDFVSRLAEDLGIHFSFEESDAGMDILVLADENSAFKPAVPASSPFRPRGEKADVYSLEADRRLVTRTFVARDYNYRNPSMDVLGEAQNGALGGGKYDEFGPHAKTPTEATFYARVRAQEAASQSLVFDGESELPGLRAGSVLTVEGHPRGELELLVTEVTHDFAQTTTSHGGGLERPYSNRFKAILKSQTFRPARVTPKPVVHGVVTGVVESAASTDYGAIDDQGRYRVAFMYDSVTGRGDGKASRPLRMAQPSASAGRGFHAPLKPGTEVIITCVNGDPDRPIIAGAVPNPQTPSPVTSANAEKSIWTTNKNSIAIDDDKPRCKVSVNGEEHVLQVGEPNGPEVGILLETKKNITERAKEVQTSYSKMKAAYTDRKTGIASKDILEAAGIPNFLSTWDKIEEAIQATADFAESCGEMMDEVSEMFTQARHDAKENKEEADEALKETRKEVFDELDITEKAKPKVVDNPDGTARYETKEEAEKRTFAEELKKPENAKQAEKIKAAAEASAEAQKELEDYEDSTYEHAAKEAGKAVKDFVDDVEDGIKKVVEYEKYAPYVDKVKKAAENLKVIGPLLKKLPSAEQLISKLSSLFSKATHQALDATVSASQKVSQAVPKASGQRMGNDVGSFSKPYNIQLSYHSAALYGWKNAFMFGGKNATIFSANSASILGRKRVDVKSAALVEVAASKVALSSKKQIDAYSDGTIMIVAKSKGVKVADDSSIVLNGQKDVHLVSDDKSLHVKANQNISLFAQQSNITMTSKKDWLVLTKEGKFEIEAAKTGKISTKEKLDLTTKADFALLADKKGTIRTKEALKINSKSGAWKTSDDVEVKTKTLKVKAKKIELG